MTLCDACLRDLQRLVDDWDHLCDVLLLDDEDRASGVILATLRAVQRCNHTGP